jgi:heme-degrading monooxygenase HmoA
MIRVIYCWRVRPGEEASFRCAWERATTNIRANTHGARGSFLLQSRQGPAEYVTIARWDSFEDWEAFWQGARSADMQSMHILAELLSTQVFDEICDHTI